MTDDTLFETTLNISLGDNRRAEVDLSGWKSAKREMAIEYGGSEELTLTLTWDQLCIEGVNSAGQRFKVELL